jgi:DNA polymerase-1
MLLQMEDLARPINTLAGCEFNLNSPRRPGEVLFHKLNLPARGSCRSRASTPVCPHLIDAKAQRLNIL